MNLIVFNIVEYRSPNGEENKKKDEENIKNLSARKPSVSYMF